LGFRASSLIVTAVPSRMATFRGRIERMVSDMWTVLVILLVAWVVLSIVGFAFKGLLWLAIIGIVLFVGTLIFGIIRQRARRPKA
jgi:hypothetical protein